MKRRVLSPEKTEELWHLLAQSQTEVHESEECLLEFRNIINPPPQLNSFSVIATNLPPILELLDKVINLSGCPEPGYQIFINKWIKLCRIFTAEKANIELSIPGFSCGWNEHENPPYRNYYESHCLGVALWCRVPGINEFRYQLVQAILILSVNRAKQTASKNQLSIDEQLAAAGLCVRKLSTAQYDKVLASLPASPVSFDFYLYLIKLIVSDSSHSLYPLVHLMEIATGEKGVLVRGPHENHTYQPKNFVEDYLTDSDGGERPGEVNVIQQIKDVHTKQATGQLVSEALCHLLEFAGVNEAIATVAKGKDPSGGRSRSQQYVEARAAAERIASDNQRLATDLDRLNPNDIVMFLEKLNQISAGEGLIGAIKRSELAAFLTVSFWTSRSIKDVISCTVVPSIAASNENISIFKETDGKIYWVIYAKKPKLIIPIELETEAQALSIAERFTLPITTIASTAIEPWLQKKPPIKYRRRRLFLHTTQEYISAIDEFFRELKKKHNGRQNFFRIESYLHDHVSRLPGSDVTAAIAISGRADKLGMIPHFYTAHSIKRIQTLYIDAVKEICNDDAEHVCIESVRGVSSTHVGSRFVPRRTVIAAFVNEVKDRLDNLRSESSSYENVIRLHNTLTAYTVLLVGFSTGYRAVSDPLFHDAEIDRNSGFAVISDKDGDDFYNSRIVWLPPVCLDQLEMYASHLKYLRHWLFTYNQELFFKSREASTIGRRADRRTPAFFYLGLEAEEFTVRPKHLKTLMQLVNYKLPVNANRHYLRTNLLEKKCPLEVLNAFMGHWERGLEPWGKYSGFSPDVYRSELAKYLVPLLKEDGWSAQKGLENRTGDVAR